MKLNEIVTIAFCVCLSFLATAQTHFDIEKWRNTKKTGKAAEPGAVIHNTYTSASTGRFLYELNQATLHGNVVDTSIINRYALVSLHDEYYVNAFVLLTPNADLATLEAYGVQFQGHTEKELLSALIPIQQINILLQNPNIRHLGIIEKASTSLDEARKSTWVHWVHNGYQLERSYQGEGVIMGFIDSGFDYTHPSFYDSTGYLGYRVLRVWEQGVNGTPPSGYTYGRELKDPQEILSSGADYYNRSHGTHVSGIAAGSGGGETKKYVGVAPKANLVLVSTNFSIAGIGDGLTYILDYAASLGKPCVVNLSLGSRYGPRDGSSAFDQFCDEALGVGKILVGSAGNQGRDNRYLGKSFTNQDTVLFTLLKNKEVEQPNEISGLFNIWGTPGSNYRVAVSLWNNKTKTVEAWTPNVYSFQNGNFSYYLDPNQPGASFCFVNFSVAQNTLNNKPEMIISVDNAVQSDPNRYVMIEVFGKNNHVDMWVLSSQQRTVFFNGDNSAPFMNGSNNITIDEVSGTGKSIISVGAYSSKNEWKSFNGSQENAFFSTPIGAIAPFSSKGPTTDGRVKPDVSAPGNVVVSATSSYDNNYQYNSNNVVYGIEDGFAGYWYSVMQGTSMAAPMVSGIIALWLEANPLLSPTEIREFLKATAYKDGYTGYFGLEGNSTWGWGKIDAHQGLLQIKNDANNNSNQPDFDIVLFPNPTSENLHLVFSEAAFLQRIEMIDVAGRTVVYMVINQNITGKLEISLSSLPSGFYVVKLFTNQKLIRKNIVVH